MSVIINEPVCVLLAEQEVSHLRCCADQILAFLGCPEAELSLSLVTDSAIAALNKEHREISSPTDVLSYSLLEGDHSEFRGGLLGDVVISVETAETQACIRGESIELELLRLLIHGILHLFGYDHQADEDARKMVLMEKELFLKVLSCD